MLGIVLILNNYFHDFLSAFFLASGLLMKITRDIYLSQRTGGNINLYIQIFRSYNKLAKWSLIGLLVAGVPRMLVFKQYEIIPAVSKGLVIALVLKHIIVLMAVIIGVIWWRHLYNEALDLKAPH